MTNNSHIFFSKADLPLPQPFKIDQNTIKTLIKKELSETPQKCTLLQSGTYHQSYLIRLSDKSVVLKVQTPDDPRKGLNLIMESKIYALLSKEKLPTVEIIMTKTIGDYPFSFQLSSLAEGVLLYSTIKPTEEKIFYNLGAFLQKVHQIPLQKFRLLTEYKKSFVGSYNNWPQFLKTNLNSHLKFLCEKNVITGKESIEIKNFLEAFQETKNQPVLLHGDLANHNIFRRSSRITAIIDWEDALAGDPIYDLAYFATGTYGNPHWLRSFLKGYTSQTKLPADFEQRFWTYYLRIAVMKSVIRIRFAKPNQMFNKNFHFRIKNALIKLKELQL